MLTPIQAEQLETWLSALAAETVDYRDGGIDQSAMGRQIKFLSAALLLAVLCCFPTQAAPNNWKPDPKFLPQLGPEVSIGQYALRLPAGYVATPPTAPMLKSRNEGAIASVYAGPDKHPDGSAPALSFAITHISKNVVTKQQITEGLQEAVQGLTKRSKQKALTWTQGLAERGTVGGIPFARWHFTEMIASPTGPQALSGFFYASVYGKMFVVISGLDTTISAAQSLPTMETAVLTLHKK